MAPHADESQEGKNGHGSGNGNGHGDRNVPRPGEYIQFECLPPGGPLNRWSQVMTREHDFPGAQVSTPLLLCRPEEDDDATRSSRLGIFAPWRRSEVVPGASGGGRRGPTVFCGQAQALGGRDRSHGCVWYWMETDELTSMGCHLGHAVRRRRPGPRHDEERAARGDRDGLVGGESVQVSEPLRPDTVLDADRSAQYTS